MPKRRRLALVAGLTLLLGLVIFLPARVAYRWFAPPALTMASISGSIWHGSAAEASAGGVYLRHLSWRMKPLALMTGRLAYAVEARPTSGLVEGTVTLGLTGNLSATDLRIAMPLQGLAGLARIPGLAGDLELQFSSLKLDAGLPVEAQGTVEVSNLVLPQVYRYPIGGYRAEFFTRESGIVASVEDVDGMIDLAGSLELSADRNYRFTAQLAAMENTPANLRQQMQFLGSANKRGQHELRLEGQL